MFKVAFLILAIKKKIQTNCMFKGIEMASYIIGAEDF